MSQCRPSTKPNNVDRPIPFRKVLAQLLKRSGDSKRSSHYCHTTEKFSNKANPRPDSFQVNTLISSWRHLQNASTFVSLISSVSSTFHVPSKA